MKPAISTRGALEASGHRILPVKEEIRTNLIAKLRSRQPLFPGIVGYDDTVVPAIVNALLGKHDVMLLGLRGQAKSRIVRLLPGLLDEWTPVVAGCEINDNPYAPVCKRCHDLAIEAGADLPVEWLHRESRLGEKLATPDVTIADLIGDIDPIKAATKRLHYSHEGAIHFGIIPRTNRGIFAINELPDLQPRIQVGLFNIMQEKDIQIRGFNVRIPLDVMIVFTANPEDYTNRGNIITPLKDRIDSQIFTHYPRSIDDAITITDQEAWLDRDGEGPVEVPLYFREIIEQAAFEARESEFVDQKSGVSARLTIAALENLVSNAERRSILSGEGRIAPRIADLHHALPGMTGKIELVFEGEQEGPVKVGKALVGKAVRKVFRQYFPDPLQKRPRVGQQEEGAATRGDTHYGAIIAWFESGNAIEIADDMPSDRYFGELDRVPGLRELTRKHLKLPADDTAALGAAMEFVLEGLHQCSRIAKEESDRTIGYKDLVGTIFNRRRATGDEDD